MRPNGGTELLCKNLIKYVGQDWLKHTNLVVSICNEEMIDINRKNILWQHLMTDQYNVMGLNNKKFTEKIDKFIYVSEWQKKKFINQFDLANYNNIVIKNAIDPIPFKQKPKDKIRLIYNSMPNRGLEILLDAFDMLDTRDIELVVYSSNIIYGLNYSKMIGNSYDVLFNRCRKHPNITYKGYAMNNVIRSAVQSSHILAYPSIFPETSCLVAIEAGAAGCKIVTTDYGALPETCGRWASYINYTPNKKELTEAYALKLKEEIENYTDEKSEEQSIWFNKNYSWLNRQKEWKEILCEK